MKKLSEVSRIRLTWGLLAIAIGVICNEWVLTALFSSDGEIELKQCLFIWMFEVGAILVGLLVLFARRSLIISLTVFCVAGLISVFLLDLLARYALVSMLYHRPEGIYKSRNPAMPSHFLFEANVEFEDEVYGDLAAMTIVDSFKDVRTIRFETDEYGYRGRVGAADEKIDLILLGDSFGSGVGTSQEEIWSELWRAKYGLRTYCLSMPGYSPWHEMIILKQELPRLRVDSSTTVVWAVFAGNDFDEPGLDYLEPPEPKSSISQLMFRLTTWYRRSPLVRLAGRIEAAIEPEPQRDSAIVRTLPSGRSTLFFSSYVRAQSRSINEIEQLRQLPRLKKVVAEMVRYTLDSGVKLAVVLIPTKGMIYEWTLNEQDPWTDVRESNQYATVLGEICAEFGIRFLDLQPALLSRAQREYSEGGRLLWWRDDSHWNGLGHAVAADTIYTWLTTPGDTALSN